MTDPTIITLLLVYIGLIMLYLTFLFCSFHFCYSLRAYDCADANLNITSISLLDVVPCPKYESSTLEENVYIQILQKRETYDVMVYRCDIVYEYHVSHCGMHSHSSRVEGGEGREIWYLSGPECLSLHRNRQGNILGILHRQLMINGTEVRRVPLTGTVDSVGNCVGGSLNLGKYTWTNVVGTAEVTITLMQYSGNLRTSDNSIVVPSGVTCKYEQHECTDIELGLLAWDPILISKCDGSSHYVIYEGTSKKVSISSFEDRSDNYTLYTVSNNGFLATLLQKDVTNICGVDMYNTEHKKLVVNENPKNLKFFSNHDMNTKDTDLFLYINAKFSHIEHHTRRELSSLYSSVMTEICETKRSELKTMLSIATLDATEFAYLYMGSPGYTGLTLGETVHVVKCREVFVNAVKHEGCYNELPVNYSSRVYYMSPKNHILQSTGTPVSCTEAMQPSYLLSNKWFSSTDKLSLTANPQTLSAVLEPTWHYNNIGDLAKDGIYDIEAIDKLRSQIMYPVERKAITQTISAIVNKDTVLAENNISSSLFESATIENQVKNYFEKAWSRFSSVGTFFSGIFGIMIVLKLIKILFDTFVNSRGLYEVYGFGWKMLAGIWDAATTYLLTPHRVWEEHNRRMNRMYKNKEDIENPDISAPLKEEDIPETIQPACVETKMVLTPLQRQFPV